MEKPLHCTACSRGTTWSRRARGARWLLLFVAAAVLMAPVPAAAQSTPVATLPATPATPAPSAGSGSLEACSTVDEASIQDELNRVTQAVFADALARVDTQAIVDTQWETLRVDRVVAQVVDKAATDVRNQTDTWNKFLSGWSGAKARELTLDITNRAFGADAFRKAMDDLSAAVATDVAAQMNTLTAESSSAALYCLQTFIKSNYAPALLAVYQTEVSKATADAGVSTSDLPGGLMSVIEAHSGALGGVGVIIATQVARRLLVTMTSEVTDRVAGGLATRLLGRAGSTVIPIAGWVVGAGMIAYDIWNNADGALPQIQETLKCEEVMAGIRGEIADAIRVELGPELPQVARDVANELYSQWAAVKRDIRIVLEMAAENEAFRNVMKDMETPAQLQRLVEVSGALTATSGRGAVLAAAENGALERALSTSADLTPIIDATGSLDTALDWVTAAGDSLPAVVTLEIYKHKSPADLDRATLQRLIAVNNPQAVADLALLPNDQLTTLLALSNESLRELAVALTPEQLGWLAETLKSMPQDGRNALVSRLVSKPELIAVLQQSNLLEELPPGADIDQAVAFMSGRADALGMVNDAVSVATGPATVGMYQGKYGWGTSALVALGGLLIMLIALRLLWAAGAWVLSPVFTIGRLGRRQQSPPSYPPHPPPNAASEKTRYGPRTTNPRKPAPPDGDEDAE